VLPLANEKKSEFRSTDFHSTNTDTDINRQTDIETYPGEDAYIWGC